MLVGANSMIPVNIEVFEGFSLSLTYSNQKSGNIIVEGVSKKGQDLLLYVPQGLEEKIVNNFSNVVNVKINFSPGFGSHKTSV